MALKQPRYRLINWLIDCPVIYAVSAIFQLRYRSYKWGLRTMDRDFDLYFYPKYISFSCAKFTVYALSVISLSLFFTYSIPNKHTYLQKVIYRVKTLNDEFYSKLCLLLWHCIGDFISQEKFLIFYQTHTESINP